MVDGLLKATPIDGYVGVYKTKAVLLFIFRKLSMYDPKRAAQHLIS